MIHIILEIKLRHCIYVCIGIALIALFSCICITSIIHHNQSTATHCHVFNFLPSISSAIGGAFVPEQYIWRCSMSILAPFRIAAACWYCHWFWTKYQYYSITSSIDYYRIGCCILLLLQLIENISLIILSYASSTGTSTTIHNRSFVIFEIASIFHMILQLIIALNSGGIGLKSNRQRIYSLSIHVISLTFSGIFFYAHNRYCWPTMYSLFALFEYIVVLTNIAYHSTIAIDIADATVADLCNCYYNYHILLIIFRSFMFHIFTNLCNFLIVIARFIGQNKYQK